MRDLNRLPPITFDSIDVCVLLAALKKTQVEVEMLKEGLKQQASTCADMSTILSEVDGRLTNLENNDNFATVISNSTGSSMSNAETKPKQVQGDTPDASDNNRTNFTYADKVKTGAENPWIDVKKVGGRRQNIRRTEKVDSSEQVQPAYGDKESKNTIIG